MDSKTNPTRRLHLVDIENLIGCPRPTLGEAMRCRDHYDECADVRPDDLVVVACNHGAVLAVGFGWRGARLLLRSGQDGADLALLDVIAHEHVEDRFAAVVVASGDGRFADAISRLGSLGIDVTVVSNGRALSRRLRLAVKHVVIFDAEPVPAHPAAAAREAA
jgi:NYN domain